MISGSDFSGSNTSSKISLHNKSQYGKQQQNQEIFRLSGNKSLFSDQKDSNATFSSSSHTVPSSACPLPLNGENTTKLHLSRVAVSPSNVRARIAGSPKVNSLNMISYPNITHKLFNVQLINYRNNNIVFNR